MHSESQNHAVIFCLKNQKPARPGPEYHRLTSETKARSVPSYVIRTLIVNQSDASGSFEAEINIHITWWMWNYSWASSHADGRKRMRHLALKKMSRINKEFASSPNLRKCTSTAIIAPRTKLDGIRLSIIEFYVYSPHYWKTNCLKCNHGKREIA